MTPIDLLEVPRLSEPRLSPDWRELVSVLAEADWKANKRITHLWRGSTENGVAIQLTRGAAGESAPRWSPDGEHIAFVTERGDDASFEKHARGRPYEWAVAPEDADANEGDRPTENEP
jgi:dipeptidyl aminopeptidase/acylaminoacyl peptidase